MLKNPTTKKGESLVEVIVAIFIVTIGSAVATSLIVSAIQSNVFSRDNLVALNLAEEGIETVRGMRDANWLKYSYDKENCWNVMPKEAECEGGKPIAKGYYTVNLDTTPNKYNWDLVKNAIALNLDDGFDDKDYRLSYFDINPDIDSDSDANLTNDHDVLAKNIAAGVAESIYYRMVQISYKPLDVGVCDNADKGTGCEEMDVVSIVQWRAQGLKHEVVLTSKLTNYQKIKSE